VIRKLVLLVGALLALNAGLAMAQGYRNEVSLFGNYTRMHQSGNVSSFSILDLGYGYYFTPQWVGKIDLTRVSSDSFGYTDLGLGAKYYTSVGRRGSFSWFFDGTLGIHTAPSQRDRRYQFGFGAAQFITESTSLDLGIHWFRVASDPYITNGTIFGIGFTTRF